MRRLFIILIMIFAASAQFTIHAAQQSAWKPILTVGRGKITDFDANPMQKYILVSASTGLWLYDRETLRDARHFEGLYGAKFSPDGKWFAAGQGSQIVILNAVTFEVQTKFDASYNRFTGLSWSPDSKKFAALWSDGLVQVWDVANEKAGLVFYQTQHFLGVSVWSPDSTRIATINADGLAIVIWQVDSQQKQIIMLTSSECCNPSGGSLRWSTDGKYITRTAGNFEEPGIFQAWDAVIGKLEHEHRMRSYSYQEYNPQGTFLALGGWNNLQLVDTKTFKVRAVLDTKIWFPNIRWSPDGETLASFGTDNFEQASQSEPIVRFWDGHTGYLLREYRLPRSITTLHWSDDGWRVLIITDDNIIQWLDIRTGKTLVEQRDHALIDNTIAWDSAGKHLAIANMLDRISLYDVDEHVFLKTFQATPDNHLLAWQPDGVLLASANFQHLWTSEARNVRVLIWNSLTGNLITSIAFSSSYAIESLQWHRDGKILVIGFVDGQLLYWTPERQLTHFIESMEKRLGHFSRLRGVMFSPAGQYLLTLNDACCVGATPVIWDANTSELLSHSFASLWRGNREYTWLPTSPILVMAHWSGSGDYCGDGGCGDPLLDPGRFNVEVLAICCEPASDDAPSVTLKGHTNYISGVAWNAERTRIVTTSDDKTARVWNANTGAQQLVINDVDKAEWSSDGSKLAVWQEDQPVRIVDSRTGNPLAVLGVAESALWNPVDSRIALIYKGQLRVWGE